VPDRTGRLTPAGALNQFPLPASYFGPSAIVAGSDGGLWFLEAGPNGGAIGRISTSGAITEFFPVPLAQESGLYGLVAGPDGALWFTTLFEVGRLSPAGAARLFAVPHDRPNDSAAGAGLASGPDRALCFVEPRANRIGRLTPVGAFTSFAVPTAAAYPLAICTGHDGNLWFTERLTSKLGRLTPLGVMTEIAVPLPQKLLAGEDDLTQIAAGSGGAIWFIEEGVDQIGFLA
jgi:virginiamycin B lyase